MGRIREVARLTQLTRALLLRLREFNFAQLRNYQRLSSGDIAGMSVAVQDEKFAENSTSGVALKTDNAIIFGTSES